MYRRERVEFDSSICSRLWTDLKKDSWVVGFAEGGCVFVGLVDSEGGTFDSSLALVVALPAVSDVVFCWVVSEEANDASEVVTTPFAGSPVFRVSSPALGGADGPELVTEVLTPAATVEFSFGGTFVWAAVAGAEGEVTGGPSSTPHVST
jgi:hypothetical protein